MARTEADTWQRAMDQHGTHSNHPVVLLSPHAFEAAGTQLFATRASMGWTVVACDPLGPAEGLAEGIEAFDRVHAREGMVYGGISEPVARVLDRLGFQVMKVGEEPWVDLSDASPRGNRGKGIRAARNQALRGGCLVEEWDDATWQARRQEIAEVFQEWMGLTFLSLEGGVLACHPFAPLEGRRRFVCLREGRIESILVASPIRKGISYYLEDLVYRRDAHRGVQELTTLAALEALAASGAREASLGLVFLRKLERGQLPGQAGAGWLRHSQELLNHVYNAEGQDLFRKRFQVARWDGSYLAFRGPRRVGGQPRLGGCLGMAWAMLALLGTLEPRLRLKRQAPDLGRG